MSLSSSIAYYCACLYLHPPVLWHSFYRCVGELVFDFPSQQLPIIFCFWKRPESALVLTCWGPQVIWGCAKGMSSRKTNTSTRWNPLESKAIVSLWRPQKPWFCLEPTTSLTSWAHSLLAPALQASRHICWCPDCFSNTAEAKRDTLVTSTWDSLIFFALIFLPPIP